MLILKWFSEKFPLKNQQLSTIIISKSTSASKKVNCQTDGSGWDFKISPCDLLCFKYSWMYILLLHSSQISGLRLMKCSSKMLQNLLYFMCMKTHVVFWVFSQAFHRNILLSAISGYTRISNLQPKQKSNSF